MKTVPDEIMDREYELWKKQRFSDCGDGSACIQRTEEGDCISEGIGYGMLVAVGFDDQDAFDKLWTYYNNHKGGGGLMGWKTAKCGGTQDSNPATDGDIDVAMALLQAACRWTGSYENDAKGVMGAISGGFISGCGSGSVIKPGSFGGCSQTNPSYFAPGYFKLFAQKTGNQSWNSLVDTGYSMVASNQSSQGGVFSDWCSSGGSPTSGPSGGSIEFGADASRVPWRIAVDYIWNNEQRAVGILDKFRNYVVGKGGPAKTFLPSSNFRGGSAFSAIHQDAVTAQEFGDAWLETAVDDETYYPGTLRLVYMLLANNRFPKDCSY